MAPLGMSGSAASGWRDKSNAMKPFPAVTLSLLQRGAEPAGARAAVLGGVLRRRAELVHELLQPGVGRRADLQLEPPGGYDDRRPQPRVRGQVHVPGGSAFGR